jgi:hypothetical protein
VARPCVSAVVLERWTTCKNYDRFLIRPGKEDVWIYVLRDDDCLMMLGGRRLMSQYRPVLLGIEFRGIYNCRSSVELALVLWTVPQMRNLLLDFHTGHAYTAVDGQLTFTPHNVTRYPGYPAALVCNDMGMYLTEIFDKEESGEVTRSIQLRNAWMGYTRTGYGLPYQYYTTGGAPTFLDWYPRQPNNVSNDCLSYRTGGGWPDRNCGEVIDAGSCEQDTYPNVTIISRSVLPVLPPVPTNARSFLYDTNGCLVPNPAPVSMLGFLDTASIGFAATLAFLSPRASRQSTRWKAPRRRSATRLRVLLQHRHMPRGVPGRVTHATLKAAFKDAIQNNDVNACFRTALTVSYVIWVDKRMQTTWPMTTSWVSSTCSPMPSRRPSRGTSPTLAAVNSAPTRSSSPPSAPHHQDSEHCPQILSRSTSCARHRRIRSVARRTVRPVRDVRGVVR